MESSDTTTTTTTTTTTSYSPTSSPPNVILSPCAACKILRRRCIDKCVLAPYFPPTEPLKFTTAHRVFGASNIIKLLQELPESQRADAVSSMVYEANARIRDPVYGCAGAICQLQKQVNELQVQLARTRAELTSMHLQQANLVTIICMEMAQFQQQCNSQPIIDAVAGVGSQAVFSNDGAAAFFLDADGGSQGSIWEEPLWT